MNSRFSEHNHSQQISNGLESLLQSISGISGNRFFHILVDIQERYFQNKGSIHSKERRDQLRYFLKSVMFKFQLSNLNLEQLWALSEDDRGDLFLALENSLDRLDVDDQRLLLISFAFEGVLFQVLSTLDVYMLYISFLLELLPVGYRGRMTESKFTDLLLDHLSDNMGDKVETTYRYFSKNIFGEDEEKEWSYANWGSLVRSLRDKIAHRDRIQPSFDSDERLIDQILFNWPTIRGVTCDYFYQKIHSGLYCMIRDLCPILYGEAIV